MFATMCRFVRWTQSRGRSAVPETFLRTALDTWAAGGSVVLTRGVPDDHTLTRRMAAEHVTAAWPTR